MKVIFIGAPIESPPQDLSISEKLQYTGNNSGNLLIGEALRSQINCDTLHIGYLDPSEANNNFDIIALPSTNFINMKFDFTEMANFIESTKLPCLMVGLGVQSPNKSFDITEIPEGTKRFLKIVADRSESIGVRGNFTAEILSKLSIFNVEAFGCPSLYTNMNPWLRVSKKPIDEVRNICFNGSRNACDYSYNPRQAKIFQAKLVSASFSSGCEFVMQDELEEMLIANSEGEFSENSRILIESILASLGADINPEEYFNFIRDKYRVFFDVDKWSNYILGMDFSLGTRFHANLIALVNGIPAIMFPHDSRTIELCELLRIPAFPLEPELLDNIHNLYEEADFEPFNKRYSQLYEKYVDFMTKNNIRHNLLNYKNAA